MVVRADVVKPLDHSGSLASNLIPDEAHVIPAGMPRPFVVPFFGAFYKESLVVTNTTTGDPIDAADYICMDLYENATFRSGQSVYNCIFFPDRPAGVGVTITYQCLGGPYYNNRDKLIQWLAERNTGGPAADFNDTVDKPKRYAPAHHQFQLKDIYGWEYVIEALGRIDRAIEVGNDPAWAAVNVHLKARLAAARVVANATTNAVIQDRLDWFQAASDKGNLGLGLVQNLETMSRSKARNIMNPAYDALADGSNHYVTVDALDAAGESIYTNFVGRNDTHIDQVGGFVAQPHRSTLLGMVVGEVVVFPTKQKLYEDAGYYDLDVYPPDVALTDVVAVTRINIHTNNYGGVWVAKNVTQNTSCICYLRSDVCDQRFKWTRMIAVGDLDKYLELVREHIADTKNPHNIDRKHIELDLLENLPVITEEEIVAQTSIRKFLTQDTLMYAMKAMLSGVKPPPPPGTEVDPDAPTMDQAQIIFTPCGDKGKDRTGIFAPPPVSPWPSKGQLVKTFCDGTDRFARYTDGTGGWYDSVLELNSDDCGYVAKPEQGKLLSTACVGKNKMGTYADGAGGTYTELIETNSAECGFVAPPPAGTVLSTYCSGTTQMTRYADGAGSFTEQPTKQNAPECGYIAPTAPPTSHTPAGTLMSERCVGVDKVGTYANGSGGTYDSVIRANDPSCGYEQPTTAPPVTQAPTLPPFRATLTTNKATYTPDQNIEFQGSIEGGQPNGSYYFYMQLRYQDWNGFEEATDITGVNQAVVVAPNGQAQVLKSWFYTRPDLNLPGMYVLRYRVMTPSGTNQYTNEVAVRLVGY